MCLTWRFPLISAWFVSFAKNSSMLYPNKQVSHGNGLGHEVFDVAWILKRRRKRWKSLLWEVRLVHPLVWAHLPVINIWTKPLVLAYIFI